MGETFRIGRFGSFELEFLRRIAMFNLGAMFNLEPAMNGDLLIGLELMVLFIAFAQYCDFSQYCNLSQYCDFLPGRANSTKAVKFRSLKTDSLPVHVAESPDFQNSGKASLFTTVEKRSLLNQRPLSHQPSRTSELKGSEQDRLLQ